MTADRRPALWPLGVIAVTVATLVSVAVDAAPAIRVPLVAVTMLAVPGIGLWRATRLTGPAVSLAGLVVAASIAVDVVAAECLLLADQLRAAPLISLLAGIGLLGTLRDLGTAERPA